MNFVTPRNDQLNVGDQIIDGKGYILDEPYIARYFDLQSPSRIAYSTRCNGFSHDTGSGHFRYCELGCGRGMTTAVLAAAHPDAEFVGIDLNPEHIAYADSLAHQAELKNVSFVQSDFVEAMDADWPKFDYITVHGVYSWVDAKIREEMFQFVSKYLKTDGIVYVSYNSYPGWSAKEPLWRLLNTHIRSIEGNSIERVKKGIEFLDFLVASEAPYFSNNPAAVEHLEYLKSEDLRYISHEFCNENFAPVYCSEIFAHADQHALNFLAQAESCYNIPFEKAPAPYIEYLEGFDDRIEREVWTSMLRNDQFRTDLYTKKLPDTVDLEDSEIWEMVFTNIAPLETLDPLLECGTKEINLSHPLERNLVHLSEQGVYTLQELCGLPELRQYSPKVILETAQMLEFSGKFAFTEHSCISGELPFDANWKITDIAISTLAKAQIIDEAAPCFASRILGTAIRMDTIDALALFAMDGADEESAISNFVSVLNEEHPDILDFKVSERWAIGYLYDFRQYWGPLLHKLGIVEAQRAD